jgi:hypothetical protein
VKLSIDVINSILTLHSEGLSNRGISRKLNINHTTVNFYVKQNNLQPNKGTKLASQMVGEKMVRCMECKEVQPISSYSLRVERRRGDGPYTYRGGKCRGCITEHGYVNINATIESYLRHRFVQLKHNAKTNSVCFSILFEEFISQYSKQNGLCFYTDTKMVVQNYCDRTNNQHTLSVDKIIPALGYVLGNVVFCTKKVNTVKNDVSLSFIEKWMPAWYERLTSHMHYYNLITGEKRIVEVEDDKGIPMESA